MVTTFYISADQVDQFEKVLGNQHLRVPPYRSAVDAKLGHLRVYEVDADDTLRGLAVLADWLFTPRDASR